MASVCLLHRHALARARTATLSRLLARPRSRARARPRLLHRASFLSHIHSCPRASLSRSFGTSTRERCAVICPAVDLDMRA
eukprot:5333097-Pleurochrysis_carterae.AAC.1